jgi:hypothetical protein
MSGWFAAGWIGILVLSASSGLGAQSSGAGELTAVKPAWQWTDRERLEARFDPVKVERRNRAVAESQGTDPATFSGRVEIDGDLHPELFLPVELFGMLQGEAFSIDPEAREGFREAIEKSLRTIRLPEGFWDDLEDVAADFFGPRQQQVRLAQKMPGASQEQREKILQEIRGLQAGECQRRQKALLAAFGRFSRYWFLRLLYEGVAPGVSMDSSTSEDQTEHLLWIQGGCR